MDNIAVVNLVMYAIVCSLSIYIGLNLKKWTSWLLGLYGFLSGAIIGFLSGEKTFDIPLGIIFAFVVIYGGAMVHRYRQQYDKDSVEAWLAQYGEDKRFSLLAHLLRKLKRK